MKICFKCGAEKPLDQYYRHKGMFDGHLNKCKACTKKDVAENQENYDITEKGVIRVIYKAQVSSSKKRGHGKVPYSKAELGIWLYANGFKHLYDDWISSGMKKGLKPSVDRIDDFKGYSFDNIKLGTWDQNRHHQISDIRNGTGTGGLRCKPVEKLDSNGNCICMYVSYSSASRDVGYSLEYPIKHGTKCRGGFYWRYV